MDKKLLSILCCPVTHKGLSQARGDVLRSINLAIESGEIKNHDGSPVTTPLKEALITDDGKTIYPIKEGIPVLLEGESVAMEQVTSR